MSTAPENVAPCLFFFLSLSRFFLLHKRSSNQVTNINFWIELSTSVPYLYALTVTNNTE